MTSTYIYTHLHSLAKCAQFPRIIFAQMARPFAWGMPDSRDLNFPLSLSSIYSTSGESHSLAHTYARDQAFSPISARDWHAATASFLSFAPFEMEKRRARAMQQLLLPAASFQLRNGKGRYASRSGNDDDDESTTHLRLFIYPRERWARPSRVRLLYIVCIYARCRATGVLNSRVREVVEIGFFIWYCAERGVIKVFRLLFGFYEDVCLFRQELYV